VKLRGCVLARAVGTPNSSLYVNITSCGFCPQAFASLLNFSCLIIFSIHRFHLIILKMVASDTVWDDANTTPFIPFSLVHLLGRTREEAHTMPYYFAGVLIVALSWTVLYKLCHYFSLVFFSTYNTLPHDKQAEWNSRIISNINAILMCFDMVYFLPTHSGVRESVYNPSVTTPPLLVTVLMMRFVGYMVYDFCLMVVCTYLLRVLQELTSLLQKSKDLQKVFWRCPFAFPSRLGWLCWCLVSGKDLFLAFSFGQIRLDN